jgi:RHS repeat-associated protein
MASHLLDISDPSLPRQRKQRLPVIQGSYVPSARLVGLDYFGARYLSAHQGRFTSPDDPFADQHPDDPQSWNLYAYVRNNPLIYADPTGGYLCGASMTAAQCDDFETGRKAAQASADKLKARYGAESARYKDAQRAIDAYGARGVDNGVSISVRPLEDERAGGETRVGGNLGPRTADNPNGQNIVVGMRPVDLAEGGVGLAALIAHVFVDKT